MRYGILNVRDIEMKGSIYFERVYSVIIDVNILINKLKYIEIRVINRGIGRVEIVLIWGK